MRTHLFLTKTHLIGFLLAFGGCIVLSSHAHSFEFRYGSSGEEPSVSSSQGWADSPAAEEPPAVVTEAPSLIVTDEPPPEVIYRRGSADTMQDHARSMPPRRMPQIETAVGRKAQELAGDLGQVQTEVETFFERLARWQNDSEALTSDYYATLAVVNAHLQAGTTAGNPILVDKWNYAQDTLSGIEASSTPLHDLADDIANEASRVSFLLEATRSTFELSGAVEEDHVALTQVEDGINQSVVRIDRMLNDVNDEINRRAAFLRTEHLNMQTLSLAIANGELYGQSISNALFQQAKTADVALTQSVPASFDNSTPLGRRPLVIIRFDRAHVDFERAVYTAVNRAMAKYPTAKFDLVAVSPSGGNAAELALSSTAARKNGETVLRSLTQMGVPMERIRLNAASSPDVASSEVRIFIR